MSGDLNDLRTSLKQSAYGFRPSLDASALAKTGRERSRRRMIIGGLAGTLAVAVAAVVAAPALLVRATVPAAPAPPSVTQFESAPTFHPARPSDDDTGHNVAKQFDSMATPVPGAVVPDGSWKTLTMATANLRVSYPPNWAMNDHWGEISITAPSGYTIILLTNRLPSSCDDGSAATERQIARADIAATTSLGKGPVVTRWRDGGEFPASINLAQHSATKPCWQRFLNYGGVDDVYLGSADNSANPTESELDQAVAILASASRLH